MSRARESRTVVVPGASLHCELDGEGSPLLLVHGFGLDGRMWEAQLADLSSDHRLIRPDLRGYGRSGLLDGTAYSHASDLAALLTALGETRAHVLGLSMGGRIALNIALAHPGMVRSLTLVDTALDGFAWEPAWSARWEAIVRAAREEGVHAAKELWLAHPLFAAASRQPALATTLRAMTDTYPGRHWLTRDPGRGSDPPAATRLGEVRVPALVVVGEEDLPDFHRIAALLEHGIAGARKVVIAGAGHLPNMERPAEFNRVVREFLRAAEPAA
jgi:3-oxoadipate enol-lactonase